MNCKNCGGQMMSTDRACPWCGSENPLYAVRVKNVPRMEIKTVRPGTRHYRLIQSMPYEVLMGLNEHERGRWLKGKLAAELAEKIVDDLPMAHCEMMSADPLTKMIQFCVELDVYSKYWEGGVG